MSHAEIESYRTDIITFVMPKEKKRSKPHKGASCEDQANEKQEESQTDSQAGSLKPSNLKIGEDSGNLKQRSEWFQKRSGRR